MSRDRKGARDATNCLRGKYTEGSPSQIKRRLAVLAGAFNTLDPLLNTSPNVKNLIRAQTIEAKLRGDHPSDTFSILLFMQHSEYLSFESKMELANHYNTPDIWWKLFHDYRQRTWQHEAEPVEKGRLEKVLQGAKNKGPLFEMLRIIINLHNEVPRDKC